MSQPDLFTAPAVARSERVSLAAKLAAFFRERPGVWVDGRWLAAVAGAYGWRSRVSNLRQPPYRMVIENRQRRETRIDDGCLYTVSEYRYVPDEQAMHTRQGSAA